LTLSFAEPAGGFLRRRLPRSPFRRPLPPPGRRTFLYLFILKSGWDSGGMTATAVVLVLLAVPIHERALDALGVG
jgi:hypothetical protein